MTMTVKWHGAEAKAKARIGAARGLKQWADDVLKDSQPHVPVSPNPGGGFLRDSGKAEVDAADLRAVVSYDSPTQGSNDSRAAGSGSMAIYVHENMTAQHDVGEAKFLENPLNESKHSGPETVRRAIKLALG